MTEKENPDEGTIEVTPNDLLVAASIMRSEFHWTFDPLEGTTKLSEGIPVEGGTVEFARFLVSNLPNWVAKSDCKQALRPLNGPLRLGFTDFECFEFEASVDDLWRAINVANV